MTTRKTFKHRVRARMEKTGERYTAARRNVGSRRLESDGNGEASGERTAPGLRRGGPQGDGTGLGRVVRDP